MLAIDYERMKEFIASSGLKQKVTAERAGLTEAQMSMILQQKRGMSASEYANICRAVGASMEDFLTEI